MATGFFNMPFGSDSPTPAELDSLKVRIATVQGMAKGQGRRLSDSADHLLDPIREGAGATGEKLLAPVDDALMSATTVADKAAHALIGSLQYGLIAPLQTAINYGYLPGGIAGAGKPAKRKRRRQAQAQPPTADPEDSATSLLAVNDPTDPPASAAAQPEAHLAPSPTGSYAGGTYITPHGGAPAPPGQPSAPPPGSSGVSPGLPPAGKIINQPYPPAPPPGATEGKPPAPPIFPPLPEPGGEVLPTGAPGGNYPLTTGGMTGGYVPGIPAPAPIPIGGYPPLPGELPPRGTPPLPPARRVGQPPPAGRPGPGIPPLPPHGGKPIGPPWPATQPGQPPTGQPGPLGKPPAGGLPQPTVAGQPVPSSPPPRPSIPLPPGQPIPPGGNTQPTAPIASPGPVPPGGTVLPTGATGPITPVTAGGAPVTTAGGRNLVIQVNACCEQPPVSVGGDTFKFTLASTQEQTQHGDMLPWGTVPDIFGWSVVCTDLPSPPRALTESSTACIMGPASAIAYIAQRVELWLAKECQGGTSSLARALKNSGPRVRTVPVIGDVLEFLVNQLAELIRCSDCFIGKVSEWIAALSNCPDKPVAGIVSLGILAGIWERWVGVLPKWLSSAFATANGFLCPTENPGLPEADAAWLKGQIDDFLWDCLCKASGNRTDYAKHVRDAGLPWPSVDEYYDWRRRGIITDAEAVTWSGYAGLRNAELTAKREKAQQWLPSPSDGIEWMLKDVADPNITGTFGLAAEFQQKYTGRVKEVFAQNAISDSDSLNIWKAHWRNMPPHTLYEMHKRLRPGWADSMTEEYALSLGKSIAPRRPAGWNPPARPEGFVGDMPVYYFLDDLDNGTVTGRQFLNNLVTTGFHLYEALGQADYPPFWRERLMAVSYNVLTRVDMRRSYETSQVDDKQLYNMLQDRGYSPVDAQRLAGFYREAYIQLMARSPQANQWVKVGYDTELLRKALIARGMRAGLFEDVLARLRARRAVTIQTECMASIKRSYLLGVHNAAQAIGALNELGVGADQVTELIAEWNCLKKSTPKHESAANICAYFKTGIIGGDQAARLLRGLGYTAMQARRILSLCYLRPLPKNTQHMPDPGTEARDRLDALLQG